VGVASLREASAFSGNPGGSHGHAQQVALKYAKLGDVRVELLFGGVGGACAVKDLHDARRGRSMSSSRSPKARCGERAVVPRDRSASRRRQCGSARSMRAN